MKPSKPESTEEDEKVSPEDEENIEGDPIAGIVEKYEGNTITIKNPDDDMLFLFFHGECPDTGRIFYGEAQCEY